MPSNYCQHVSLPITVHNLPRTRAESPPAMTGNEQKNLSWLGVRKSRKLTNTYKILKQFEHKNILQTTITGQYTTRSTSLAASLGWWGRPSRRTRGRLEWTTDWFCLKQCNRLTLIRGGIHFLSSHIFYIWVYAF